MEWWLVCLVVFGGLAFLFALGIPIALAFVLLNVTGVYLVCGGEAGLRQLTLSLYGSVASFTMLPVVLFVFMGMIIFESGMGSWAIEVLDRWMGHVHGRLAVVTVWTAAIVGALVGTTFASTALLGTILLPEMKKRNYSQSMTLGPIIGSAGLSLMIPPSGMAVIIAAFGEFSVGQTLIGGIIPGLIMASLYSIYIVVKCRLDPSLAPSYEVTALPLSQKLILTAKYVLPLGFIMFMVTGVILLGVATPSEAAATGLLSTIILAACYRKLTWGILKKSLTTSVEVGVMVLMITAGSMAFGQILAFSGGTPGLARMLLNLHVAPIILIILIQTVFLFFGCITEIVSLLMISMPIFVPIIRALGFDPVWFGVIMLTNAMIAGSSPPFGSILFVMRGVAPPEYETSEIYKAGLPYIVCDVIALGLMLAFPKIVLWLPSLMR